MKRDKLAELNSVQIAVLTVLGSAAAAVGVLIGLRMSGIFGHPAQEVDVPSQPAVETSAPVTTPQHFSENVILPGITETGEDVVRDDEENGRSPAGV